MKEHLTGIKQRWSLLTKTEKVLVTPGLFTYCCFILAFSPIIILLYIIFLTAEVLGIGENDDDGMWGY